jgi:hypothetical protein
VKFCIVWFDLKSVWFSLSGRGRVASLLGVEATVGASRLLSVRVAGSRIPFGFGQSKFSLVSSSD